MLKTIPRGRTEAIVLAVTTFGIYAAGACSTIYVGDSGELVTAVYTLGIPHPSGYPLYILLGKIWTILLPFGSPAARMSLFSAACAAATIGVLHLLGRRLGMHPVAAATSASLLAVSPSFWGEANVQRVYSLNALFVVLSLYVAVSWHRSRKDRLLFLSFFLCGLGAANHTFMAVQAAALAAFIVMERPRTLNPRKILTAFVSFVAGLLPYIYLPLRSRANPILDWGNSETFAGFLDVVFRRDYWDQTWIETPWDGLLILGDYLRGIGEELFWVGAVLAVIGAFVGFRRGWPVTFPLLVMAGNLAAIGLHGSRNDLFIWHRYYIPSYVMAIILAGVGTDFVVKRLSRPYRFLPLAVPVLGLLLGWRHFDRSQYRIAEDFSRQLLESLPQEAHLAASDDNVLFPLMYLRWVEGLRPDVDLIPRGVGKAEIPPLHFHPETDPVYFTHHPNWQVPGLEVVPVGLVFRVARSGAPPPPAQLPDTDLAGARDQRVPKDHLTQNLIGHYHFMLGSTWEGRDWRRAMSELQEAAEAAPDNDVLFYNLGLIYARNGLYPEALRAFRRSRAINPRRMSTGSRARASDRVARTQDELYRVHRVESELSGELPPPATTERHRLLGDWLEARGETVAARGHRIRALLLHSRTSPDSGDLEGESR